MKLSVCIPVYGVESFIERCARSLFAQTCDDMEFVFVDDCTPDRSIDVIRRVLTEFPARADHVVIVRHDKNAGLIRARKTALAHATGDLVAHCDSDDWLDPDFYARMVARFAEPNIDMVFAPMVRNESDPMPGARTFDFSGSGRDYLDAANRIAAFNSTVNKVWRREIALADVEVPDHLKIGEDLCRTAQTVWRCRRVESVAGAAYHYRANVRSMSRTFDLRRAFEDLLEVHRILATRLPANVGRILRKQLLCDIYFRGMKFGVMTADELSAWRADVHALADIPWPPDTNLKQRIMLEAFSRSYPLARWLFRHLSDGKVTEF